MKIAILGLTLCFVLPVVVFVCMGTEVVSDANMVVGIMAIGAVIFLMGCLCVLKNMLSRAVDVVIIVLGACLLLVGAFARPLGLYDGDATHIEAFFNEARQEVRAVVAPSAPATSPAPAQDNAAR